MAARLASKAQTFEGGAHIEPRGSGGFTVNTAQIQLRASVQVDTSNPLVVGFIQVCNSNTQCNTFTAPGERPAEERWEFSHDVVSDSDTMDHRPWYGTDSDPFLGDPRRVVTHGASVYDVSMSDNFNFNVAKFETLSSGSAGPRSLSRVQRDQAFRFWLVAAPLEGNTVNWNSVEIMWSGSWRYQLDIDVANDCEIVLDRPTFAEAALGAVPRAAFDAPTANLNQQLGHYEDGQLCHVVVERQEE